MANTIKYKDLQDWYLNDKAKETAKKFFGDIQPSIHSIGFYSSPSWNWGYQIGIVGIRAEVSKEVQWFEVITQFGQVIGARFIHLPITQCIKN